jgi:hypothetical protein
MSVKTNVNVNMDLDSDKETDMASDRNEDTAINMDMA